MVGAACAFYAARAGLDVIVVDRGPVAGGTTGAGEGNLLVSDKEPGPELDLALLSGRLWSQLAEEIGEFVEYETKGGLVVASTPDGLTALERFAEEQRAAGVAAVPVQGDALYDLEPHLAPALPGGVYYPQDSQVMPALAAAHLVRISRARLLTGRTVTDVLLRPDGTVGGVRTDRGDILAPTVVNAAAPGHLGRRTRRPRRSHPPRPPAPRLRPGHRTAPAHGPPQGVRRRLRGRRGQRLGRPADLPGRGGHRRWTGPDRREP